MSRPPHHPLATGEATRDDTSHPVEPEPALAPEHAREPEPVSEAQRSARRAWPRHWGRHWWRAPAAIDTAACLAYLAFAGWLFHGLWPDPHTSAIADNVNDQALIEWFLSHGVLFWTGDFSLVTDRLNAPDGVNLMSNASHITHGVVMAPVTALFGAAVTFAVLSVLNLAATAAGWYLLLARGLRLNRGAAFVAGMFAGFAPGMFSQANSHLHMTAQWLVPPIVWCVIRLTRVASNRQIVTTAAGLAVLVAAQLFLGEEVLFLAALTLLLFAGAYALRRPAWTRQVAPRFLAGMAIAGGLATVMLAYPLWIQFRGPQSTPNAPFGAAFFYADVASYATFSPLSVAGSAEAGELATSSAEYNTYFGVPLLLALLAVVIWRWRSPVTVAAAFSGIVMTLLSFGPHVTLNGEQTGWPSLYSILHDVPVISGALPTRYALALVPLAAVLLAYAMHEGIRRGRVRGGRVRGGRVRGLVVPAVVVAAVLPTLPRPMAITDRPPVPDFIASGAWRECAPDGGVLVPVPLPTPRHPDLMRWPAHANAAFAIPEGFFIGPYGPGGRSSLGTYPRPTSKLLADVATSGEVPKIDDTVRDQARQDLAFWQADCVALAKVPNEEPLRETLEEILGPPQRIADTWTWRVAG